MVVGDLGLGFFEGGDFGEVGGLSGAEDDWLWFHDSSFLGAVVCDVVSCGVWYWWCHLLLHTGRCSASWHRSSGWCGLARAAKGHLPAEGVGCFLLSALILAYFVVAWFL